MRGEKVSLFEWITRYRPSDKRFPGEDMVTQALAAVLDASPELTHAFAEWMLGPAADEGGPRSIEGEGGVRPAVLYRGAKWDEVCSAFALGALDRRPDIETQVKVSDSNGTSIGRVDLQLTLHREDASPFVWWFENKVWADLPRGQLENYVASRGVVTRGEPFGLVLLAPSRFEFPPQLPDRAAATTWALLGRFFRYWHTRQLGQAEGTEAERRAERYDCWLVERFLDYLIAEGLYSEEPMDADLIEFSERYEQSRQRLDEFLDGVERRVEARALEGLDVGGTRLSFEAEEKPGKRYKEWPSRTRLFHRTDHGGLLDEGLFGEGQWLEWRLGNEPGQQAEEPNDEKPSNWCLAAGLGFEPTAAASNDRQDEARRLVETAPSEAGLDLYPDLFHRAWVIGWIRLPELLKQAVEKNPDELDDQMDHVADWILDRFEAVASLLGPS